MKRKCEDLSSGSVAKRISFLVQEIGFNNVAIEPYIEREFVPLMECWPAKNQQTDEESQQSDEDIFFEDQIVEDEEEFEPELDINEKYIEPVKFVDITNITNLAQQRFLDLECSNFIKLIPNIDFLVNLEGLRLRFNDNDLNPSLDLSKLRNLKKLSI